MPQIHPMALVESGAEIADDAFIGPYCIVGPQAVLKRGVKLFSHVIIANETIIGENTIVHPFASLGVAGQIYQNQAAPGRLVIGARCEIREYVTMNCGSMQGNQVTEIGDDCMFMVGAHVAHDCVVGRNCIFANNATLGGHVTIGDYVFLGGLSAVHQFCTIGEHSIVGGVSGVKGHVIPFASVTGDVAKLIGLNIIGLGRRGFSHRDIKTLHLAYRYLFHGPGVFADRLVEIENKFNGNEHVQRVTSFIHNIGKRRSLVQPALRYRHGNA